jgi:predicted metal-dependent hydrolase
VQTLPGLGPPAARPPPGLNWPIIKAPHPVVDNVVIHELAHLVHPNHSRPFWLLVERHCPGYARHRTWLKERARELL